MKFVYINKAFLIHVEKQNNVGYFDKEKKKKRSTQIHRTITTTKNPNVLIHVLFAIACVW